MTEEGEAGGARLPAAELQRRAISGSTWTAVHTFVALPVGFAANAIIARSLGVSTYGQLTFLTASLAVAYAFANFGFSSAFIQRGSQAEARGHRSDADDLLRRSLGFHTLVELPLLIVIGVALTRGDPLWEVATVSVAVVFTCLFGGVALSITIENRTAAAARLAMAMNLVVQAACVATALATTSASAVWVVRMLIGALGLLPSLLLVDRERRRTVLAPRLPRGLGRAFWRYALTSWASGLVGLLVFSRSEIFLLQAFHKTEALGLFALAFGLSQQLTGPVDAMMHALLPAVAGVLSAWPERALQAFDRATRVSSLLSGALAATVIPALVFVVPLVYGDAFRPTAWLFVPLAFLSAFQSAGNPVLAFANGRQRGGLILRANVAALVVNVAAAIVLIPWLGAWGAVSANVAAQLVGLFALVLTEPFAVRDGPRGLLRLYRPFLVGAAIGVAVLAIGLLVQDDAGVVTPLVVCALGAGSYAVAVRLVRCGLAVADRDALLGAMGASARPYLSRLLQPLTTGAAA